MKQKKCICGSVQFDYAGRCLACKSKDSIESTSKQIQGKKKEICNSCGQKINREIYVKNMKKKMIKAGLPSFAKLITMIEVKKLK